MFETLERADVAKHEMRKPLAINSAFEEHTRKIVLDRFCSSAGIEVAHCGVSIKDWRAKLDKHRSDCRFSIAIEPVKPTTIMYVPRRPPKCPPQTTRAEPREGGEQIVP